MSKTHFWIVLAALAFVFYELSVPDDLRQPAGSSVRKQNNGTISDYTGPRILLYITTHMSKSHRWYLDTCWPRALLHSSLLSNADVLVYLTASKSDDKEASIAQLNSTFNNQKLKVHVANNPGWQAGATVAMKDATLNKWFVDYDWIIRMNPDVIIRNDTFLRSTINNDTNATAILIDCTPKELDRNKLTPKMRAWNGPLVQTDFFALKPSVLKENAFVVPSGNLIAEKLFTNDIRESILNKGGARFIEGVSPMTGKSCRAGDGRGVENTPIVHIHYNEAEQTDSCPIPFQSLPK